MNSTSARCVIAHWERLKRDMTGFLSQAVTHLRPHPEERPKGASRRMDTRHGLAAILRDGRARARPPQDEVRFGSPTLNSTSVSLHRPSTTRPMTVRTFCPAASI